MALRIGQRLGYYIYLSELPLYYLLRIFVWLGLKIFCRNIHVNRPELLKIKGPLILASNHPNAFLDAIILGSLFHQPVHFLARGDVFRQAPIRRMLHALQLIPIYRLTEGKEHLSLNEQSFSRCHQILSSGGIVLIFAEGLSLNQWMLRPMKKGTARIALNAWGEPGLSASVRVLPVSLNYNAFERLSKTLVIHFGELICRDDLSADHPETKKMHRFNVMLSTRLHSGTLQSTDHIPIVQTLISNHHQQDLSDLKKIQPALEEAGGKIFAKLKMPGSLADGPLALWGNIIALLLLFPAAAVGWILHIPLYLPMKKIIQRKTKGNGFFDSVLFCVLLVLYPPYWLLLNVFIQPFARELWPVSISLVFMPLLGWISLYWNECWLRVRNYWILSPADRRLLQMIR